MDPIVQRVRLAAYAWIEHEERVLLVRISAGTPGAGLWTLPGGGLRFGEDPIDGVVREVAEETGLTAAVGELAGVRSAVLDPGETPSGHRIHAVGILYRRLYIHGPFCGIPGVESTPAGVKAISWEVERSDTPGSLIAQFFRP